MRKADLVAIISEKTGVPKVDVLVSLEMFFQEVKDSLAEGENVYIRGFGSFIINGLLVIVFLLFILAGETQTKSSSPLFIEIKQKIPALVLHRWSRIK